MYMIDKCINEMRSFKSVTVLKNHIHFTVCVKPSFVNLSKKGQCGRHFEHNFFFNLLYKIFLFCREKKIYGQPAINDRLIGDNFTESKFLIVI